MDEAPIEVERHSYTNPDLEGLYDGLLDEERPLLVLDESLSREDEEALEAEARCYRIRGPRHGLKFCYSPRDYHGMDRERVRALRRCIETTRPDWAEQVRLATLMDNDVYTIVHLSGVPPYPAVAILENMAERGELPAA